MKKLLSICLVLYLSFCLPITCVATSEISSIQPTISFSRELLTSPRHSLYKVKCIQTGSQTVRATFIHTGFSTVSEVLVHIQYVDPNGAKVTANRSMGPVGTNREVSETFYIPNMYGRWYTAQAFYSVLVDGQWQEIKTGVLTNSQ